MTNSLLTRTVDRRRFTRLAAAAAAALAAPRSVRGQAQADEATSPRYAVAPIGVLDGDAYSVAWKINAAGQVAGESGSADGVQHPVVFRDGKLEPVVATGAVGTANGINDQGRLAGSYAPDAAGMSRRAAVWENGAVTDLGVLGGGNSIAAAINGAGQVAGTSNTKTAPDAPIHAFLWSDGKMKDLGTLSERDGAGSTATGVNDAGQVVGSTAVDGAEGQQPGEHAFLWHNDEMLDLGTLGGDTSVALAINAAGQVVGASTKEPGQAYFGAGTRGFLWKDGKMSPLRPLADSDVCMAADISDSGTIVGTCGAPGTTDLFAEPVAVVWIDGYAVDLNTLLPANSGWVLLNAHGINDAGQIVGDGFFAGLRQGYVLTPAAD